MKYQLFYIIVAFLSFTACKDDYECTTYQMDGKGEALPIKVELLEEVVKSDVDYYAKNTPYTLCLDEKDREVFSYSDSSILAKVWDCAGVHGGGAYIGPCGDCVGGTTGKLSCNSNDGETNNNGENIDCAGVVGGTAYLDECENCVEGTTGRYPCVSDIDGNYYTAVKIGTQIWMAENLRTTRFNNGTTITNASDNITWSSLDNKNDPAMCWQENNASYKFLYGGLYNYYAAIDTRNICPTGWRVPTYNDWLVLQNNAGENVAANNLKSTTGWLYNGIDTYGYNALPGGYRSQAGGFSNIRNEGIWWSNSNASSTSAHLLRIYSSVNSTYIQYYDKGYGASIRCIKE